MPSTETEIWLAIKARVQDAAGHLSVAWPAEDFFPVAGTPFLQVSNLINQPTRLSLAPGPHDRTGVLLMVLVYPFGQAVEVSGECAAQIGAQFPADLKLRYGEACVKVESAAHVMEGFRDGGWWRTPINVFWRALA
jgi:hypothetical protein